MSTRPKANERVVQVFLTVQEARMIVDGSRLSAGETRPMVMRIMRALIEDEEAQEKEEAMKEVQILVSPRKEKKVKDRQQ